jgi:hypothetical protein
MIENFFKKLTNDLQIEYAVYGNFHLKQDGDDDIDVLIRKRDHKVLKKYLDENNIKFHERKYYPGQIFITDTEIKIHVTDDLYLGGRKVQYLTKMGAIEKALSSKEQWQSLFIIDYNQYKNYRIIKSFLNHRKKKKFDEHPFHHKYNKDISKFPVTLFSIAVIKNLFQIPLRIFNKHIWARW